MFCPAFAGIVIYLCIATSSLFFISNSEAPLPNLSFLLEGFTAFHFLGFPKNSVTVALSELLKLIRRLSQFARRNLKIKSLGLLIHLAQTLLASQPVLAWTFLMEDKQPCDYPKIALNQIYSTICLPKTSFSKRLIRFKIS